MSGAGAALALGSPFGDLVIRAEGGAISALRWGPGPRASGDPLLREAAAQIAAYCAGARRGFDLPLEIKGSDFQQRFLRALIKIPFGEVRTYGALAGELGVSAQAIGQACGANPIPILIPCHRVLGARGLGGFSGGVGVETKVQLLRHEGAASVLI